MFKPLVKIHLWSGLRALAGGQDVVEVRASNIGQMLDTLVSAHPVLKDAVDAGVSVSVDGKIYAYGLTQELSEDSEIYLLQRIKGG